MRARLRGATLIRSAAPSTFSQREKGGSRPVAIRSTARMRSPLSYGRGVGVRVRRSATFAGVGRPSSDPAAPATVSPREREALPHERITKAVAVGGNRVPVVGLGKWIGRTNVPVSATWARRRRRDCAACTGSKSKIVDQSGSRHCSAWCIRSPVTTASWP